MKKLNLALVLFSLAWLGSCGSATVRSGGGSCSPELERHITIN